MQPRLLVIQHEDEAPPAWFGEWIEASGVELSVVLAHRGEPVPDSLDGYGGLLVTGGAMGANDDGEHAWLVPTKRLIARVVADSAKPFLGICLGHQLGAVAMGGDVAPNPAGRTLGLMPVRLTDAGRTDPLLGDIVGSTTRAVHYNDDIVTRLPPAASALATAPDGTVQAARFGPLGWGVQFHPEVSPQVFAGWGASDPAAVADVATQVVEAEHELRSAWQPLAERFAAMVTSAP